MGTYFAYILTGLAAGFASALLGIGGGVIMVPTLIFLFSLQARSATATSLAYIAPIALAGALFAAYHGESPRWQLVAVVVPGGLLGAFLGRWASVHVSDAHVKILFALLMVVVGVRLGLEGWKGLGNSPPGPAGAAEVRMQNGDG